MELTRSGKNALHYSATEDGIRFDLTKPRKGTRIHNEARPWLLRVSRMEGCWPNLITSERFDSRAAAESFADAFTA